MRKRIMYTVGVLRVIGIKQENGDGTVGGASLESMREHVIHLTSVISNASCVHGNVPNKSPAA